MKRSRTDIRVLVLISIASTVALANAEPSATRGTAFSCAGSESFQLKEGGFLYRDQAASVQFFVKTAAVAVAGANTFTTAENTITSETELEINFDWFPQGNRSFGGYAGDFNKITGRLRLSTSPGSRPVDIWWGEYTCQLAKRLLP